MTADHMWQRAALIEMNQANCEVADGQPVSGDTTYLTVVDRDGNIASWTEDLGGFWVGRDGRGASIAA